MNDQEAVGAVVVATLGIAAIVYLHSVNAWRRLGRMRGNLIYVPFAASFVCFWFVASEDWPEIFTDGQWKLLGWTLLAIGVALSGRRFARSIR